ncbi:GGDEF domain-containing protein [Virgisporangium aliadipatigenens]|nr:GGDEF domain-containing protein [Virgisporangium aliadipatigenens]
MDARFLSRDRRLIAIAVAAVLAGAVFGLDLLPLPAAVVCSWALTLAFQLMETVLAVRIGATAPARSAARRFWWGITVTVGLFAVGTVIQLGAVLLNVDDLDPARRGELFFGLPISLGLVDLGALVLIVSLLGLPLGLPSGRERQRFWIDAASVMVAVGLFAWEITGLGEGHEVPDGQADLVHMVLAPAAFVVVAFGIVKITLGGSAPFTRSAAAFACVAAALESLNAGLGKTFLESGHASWNLGLGLLANLACVACLHVQLRHTATPARPKSARSFSLLPYLSVGVTFALLIVVLADDSLTFGGWLALGCAIVSTGLVAVRQLIAFVDNDRLLKSLNVTVWELAEAQDILTQTLDERDQLAARLSHLAYHDPLTGLANRALFLERAAEALARRDALPTIVNIDLDEFKPVNDRFGHDGGDQLLREIAGRLVSCVGGAGTVARLGGDEFAILLPHTAPEAVEVLVSLAAAAVRRPVALRGGAVVSVGASIGTAVAERPGEDLHTLMQRADLRMYAEKRAARSVPA